MGVLSSDDITGGTTATTASTSGDSSLLGTTSSGSSGSSGSSSLPDWASTGTTDLGVLAGATKEATTYEVDADKSTVAGQLGSLLAKDSPWITRARTKAAQTSAARGLGNSSIAAGAGEAAAIDAALPIAQQDATSYLTAQRDNTSALNAFATDQNAFQREGALQQYQGVLSMKQAADEQALQREQMSHDEAYRSADLAYRNDALDLQRDQLEADKDKTAAAERQTLSQNMADLRAKASNAIAALEADANMSADAKAAAITAIAAKADADIQELIKFSGVDLPESWPDWLSTFSTGTSGSGGGSSAGSGSGSGSSGGQSSGGTGSGDQSGGAYDPSGPGAR